jgi:TP901 family phage tail tape measure protein
VAALYGTLRVLRTGVQGAMMIESQTAKLNQVFRGVGGTATDLADDVVQLAAAYGRSSREAMESAVAWSRLGLNRAEVNEAVRTSLMAANVAELTAAQATQKLSGIMLAYNLRAKDLGSVLGQLNQVSNTFSVRNADLLEGLSRTAAFARQARLPFAELVGLLGATVGATGQSGANIGNAIKSITVALSNPATQEMLRRKFKFEVRADTGELKTLGELLDELWVKFQGMSDLERQTLLAKIGGKTQGSRLTEMFNSYVQGMVLAINAQLHLNSAQEENKKIVSTLAAQLQGLVAEFERFARPGAFGQALPAY